MGGTPKSAAHLSISFGGGISMQTMKRRTTFAIDGYEVSVTFAERSNTEAMAHVKNILLSAFASHTPEPRCKGTVDATPEVRYNNDRGKPYAP